MTFHQQPTIAPQNCVNKVGFSTMQDDGRPHTPSPPNTHARTHTTHTFAHTHNTHTDTDTYIGN